MLTYNKGIVEIKRPSHVELKNLHGRASLLFVSPAVAANWRLLCNIVLFNFSIQCGFAYLQDACSLSNGIIAF